MVVKVKTITFSVKMSEMESNQVALQTEHVPTGSRRGSTTSSFRKSIQRHINVALGVNDLTEKTFSTLSEIDLSDARRRSSMPVMLGSRSRFPSLHPVITVEERYNNIQPVGPTLTREYRFPPVPPSVVSVESNDTIITERTQQSVKTVETIKTVQTDLSETSGTSGSSGTTVTLVREGLERNRFWVFIVYLLTWFIPHLCWRDRSRREKYAIIILVILIYLVIMVAFVLYPLLGCSSALVSDQNFLSNFLGSTTLYDNRNTICNVIGWATTTYVYTAATCVVLGLIAMLSLRYSYSRYDKTINTRIILHVPIYNEDLHTLRKTVGSLADTHYEGDKKLMLLVVDGLTKQPDGRHTYKVLLSDVLYHLPHLEDDLIYDYVSVTEEGASLNRAHVYHGYLGNVPYMVVVKVGGDNEVKTIPGNRGKRDSQLIVYDFISHIHGTAVAGTLYPRMNHILNSLLHQPPKDYKYVLVADCDTWVEPTSVSRLVSYLNSHEECIGVCGETKVGNCLDSVWALAQVFEYWLTHSTMKAMESFYANVTVLSGCFSMYRILKSDGSPGIIDQRIIQEYKGLYEKTLHESSLLLFGEDRFFSTLLPRFHPEMRLSYLRHAYCTTTVPSSLKVLLCQRRRWTNSLIHCHFSILRSLPNMPMWRKIGTVWVILCELWMVFLMPITLPVGFAISWWGFLQFLNVLQIKLICLGILLLPAVLPVLTLDVVMVLFWVPFFLTMWLFTIVIPLYSFIHMDDFKWGKTRR